jgi:hypothetical protein
MTISLLGPLLTIVVSGLFTPSLIPQTHGISLPVTGWFDVRNASSTNYHYASWDKYMPQNVIYNLAIQYNNLTFPPGTYDEFAYSNLDTSSLPPSKDNGTLRVRIPAARGQLNCSLHASFSSISGKPPGAYYIPITPPAGCTAGANATPAARNSSLLYLTATTTIIPSKGGFFGAWAGFTGTYWTPPSFDQSGSEPDLRVPYTVCGDGRQHLFFFYGHAASNTTVDSLAVMHCTPYVEALELDVSLTLPNLDTDRSPDALPKIVPGSVQPFTEPNSVPLPFQALVEDGFFNFDSFFNALIFGYQGIPVEELMGGGNRNVSSTAQRMMDRMQHLYAQLVAQSLHFNFRVPVNNGTGGKSTRATSLTPGLATGTLVDSSRTRLLQSSVSTRILEALLVIMLACALTTFLLNKRARILSTSPGSLAARMALLAESKILTRLWSPDNNNDPDYKTVFTRDDRFALGWWSDSGGRTSTLKLASSEYKQGHEYYGIDLVQTDRTTVAQD